MKNFATEDLTTFFEYLDELCDSGITNMFGAAPILAAEFGVQLGDARAVLSVWMHSFSPDTSAADRAAAVNTSADL